MDEMADQLVICSQLDFSTVGWPIVCLLDSTNGEPLIGANSYCIHLFFWLYSGHGIYFPIHQNGGAKMRSGRNLGAALPWYILAIVAFCLFLASGAFHIGRGGGIGIFGSGGSSDSSWYSDSGSSDSGWYSDSGSSDSGSWDWGGSDSGSWDSGGGWDSGGDSGGWDSGGGDSGSW
jgi:hypothetical protein